MAAAFVAERGSTQNKTSGATTTIALTGTVVVGNKLFLCVARDAQAISSVTDGQGNTWAEAIDVNNTGGVRSGIWYSDISAELQSVNNVTITWAANETAKACLLLEWSGVATGAPADTASATATGTVAGWGSDLLGTNDGAVVAALGWEGPSSDTATQPTGYTNRTKVGTSGGGATSNITLQSADNAFASGDNTNYNSVVSTSRDLANVGAAWGPLSGNQTVTPTTASLTTTTFAPTVTASDHKTVTPSVASLALATFAPSAIIGNIVVPTTASLSLATFAPTVSVSDNKVATPDVASLSLATFAPSVAITDHKTVVPDVAALVLATFAPTVTASDHKIVTPDVAALVLTTFAPTVTGGAGTTVTPTTASLVLATFAPTVTASDHKVATPDVAALSLSAFAPVIGLGIIPSTAALTLATFAPSVTASDNKVVTPTTATLTSTTFAPVVSVSDNKTVTPDVVALSLSAFAPTVTASDHKTVVPGPLALTLTAFAPDVTAGAGSTTRAHFVMWIQDDLG